MGVGKGGAPDLEFFDWGYVKEEEEEEREKGEEEGEEEYETRIRKEKTLTD